MTLSLREGLAAAGRPPPTSIADACQSFPTSVRELIQAASLPPPDLGRLEHRRVMRFDTENAQGVAFGPRGTCFLSAESCVYRYAVGGDPYRPGDIHREAWVRLADLTRGIDEAGVRRPGAGPGRLDYDHVGDIAWHDGLLFAPIHSASSSHRHVIVAMTADLRVVGHAPLETDTKDSWCAVNPWDGHLYLANRNDSSLLDRYDISGFARARDAAGGRVAMPRLARGFRLTRADGSADSHAGFQGVCFSPAGRLYVARWVDEWLGIPDYSAHIFHNYLRVYCALTGVRLDASSEYDFANVGDEIEGISVHPSGVLYVAVCDNNLAPESDELHVYAFRYRGHQVPM